MDIGRSTKGDFADFVPTFLLERLMAATAALILVFGALDVLHYWPK